MTSCTTTRSGFLHGDTFRGVMYGMLIVPFCIAIASTMHQMVPPILSLMFGPGMYVLGGLGGIASSIGLLYRHYQPHRRTGAMICGIGLGVLLAAMLFRASFYAATNLQ